MSDTNNYHSLSLLKTGCRNILQNMAHLLRKCQSFGVSSFTTMFLLFLFFCKKPFGVGAGDKTNRNKEFIGITFGKFDIVAQHYRLWSNWIVSMKVTCSSNLTSKFKKQIYQKSFTSGEFNTSIFNGSHHRNKTTVFWCSGDATMLQMTFWFLFCRSYLTTWLRTMDPTLVHIILRVTLF